MIIMYNIVQVEPLSHMMLIHHAVPSWTGGDKYNYNVKTGALDTEIAWREYGAISPHQRATCIICSVHIFYNSL